MKRILPTTLLVMLTLGCLARGAVAASPSYFQGWDVANDPAGWLPNTIGTTVAEVSSGGNPNGYLESSRKPTGTFAIGALSFDPGVTGNYAAAGIDQVSFDVRFEQGAPNSAVFRLRYLDDLHNGWFIPFTSVFTSGVWKSYAINFDPTWTDTQAAAAGWIQESTSASFAQTCANVYYPEVRIDGPGLPLVAGIDNFRLTGFVTDVHARTWGNLKKLYR